MMKKSILITLLILVIFGCANKPKTQGEASLNASMSDAQILQSIGLDETTMSAKRVQGKDGYSTTYTDLNNSVVITRSMFSGITVIRDKPLEKQHLWSLSK